MKGPKKNHTSCLLEERVYILHKTRYCQGRRKHLRLGGGHNASRTRFPLKKGTFSKNEKGTSSFIARTLGGHVPPVPPGSYIYRYCGLHFSVLMSLNTNL